MVTPFDDVLLAAPHQQRSFWNRGHQRASSLDTGGPNALTLKRLMYQEPFLDTCLLSKSVPTRVLFCPGICHSRLRQILSEQEIAYEALSRVYESRRGICLVEFIDIRDAIELFLHLTTEFGSGGCHFACNTILERALALDWKPHCVSLIPRCESVLVSCTTDTPDSVENLVETVKDVVRALGPVLFSTATYHSTSGPTVIKLFFEYLDSSLTAAVMDRLLGVQFPSHWSVHLQPVKLCLNDKEALFFSEAPFEAPVRGSHSRRSSSFSISSIGDSLVSSCIAEESPPPLPPAPAAAAAGGAASDLAAIEDEPAFCKTSEGAGEAFFEINLSCIAAGLDSRTTCMIRNIPNKYTQHMLIDMINETHFGTYDFVYLRMDFKNRCNVGYAFINFTDPKHIVSFAKRVSGKKWPRFNSDKICHLTYARIQGQEALIEKFRHSKVMLEPTNYQPKLFCVNGSRRGQEEPFPQ